MEAIDLGLLEIGNQIGQGGYGTVYEACFKNLGYRVAVKVLDPSPFQGSGAMDRFIQEAKILLTLRHPHVISIYGAGVHKSKPYIVMEYFAGMNLYQACEKQRPTGRSVIPFIRMCAQALGHAHAKGIVHRDIKPSNLMTIKGDARVIDFGISKIIDPNGDRFTKSGQSPVGGVFTAPELADNPKLVDPKCDIYSLGACWFWLITGQSPIGRNWETSLTAIGDVTPDYRAVVLKTLDQSEKRFETMEELVYELDSLENNHPTASQTEQCVDDDALLVLGILFEQEEPGEEGVTMYAIEKQVNQTVPRIRLKLALSRLEAARQIEIRPVSGWNETYHAYFVTASGKERVNRFQERIVELLATIKPETEIPSQSSEDDIPF